MLDLSYVYLFIIMRIFTGSLFYNDILSLYDSCMPFVYYVMPYIQNNIGTA